MKKNSPDYCPLNILYIAVKKMYQKIGNIEDLVSHLEGYQVIELRKDLKIRIGESLSVDQIKEIILDTCRNNTENLGMYYENAILDYYSIYKVHFTEEFQDDVYYRNREWLDILFFLINLYGYDYFFNCYDERIHLEPPEYIDFFQKAGLFVDPYCGHWIDSFFYYENEKKINALFQKENRLNKVNILTEKIKANACDDRKTESQKYAKRNN